MQARGARGIPLGSWPGATYVLPIMKRLEVDVWSDIACPWCYVGKRRLEAAIARFPSGGAVDVVWRAFELDPSAPRVRDSSVSYAERLAKKYGTGVAEAKGMLQRMTDVAAGDGLDFHFERIQSGNTFDAHRVLHLAHDRGVQDAVKERFLRGYMTEGEPIGEPEALVRLAGEAKLDPEEVRAVLAGDAYGSDVRADEEQARAAGISGVPFFVFGGRYAVSGAQSADVLLGALKQAWAEKAESPIAEGAVCGPDGC
jgi:predicted DsbA family dithiol-disulfide isomerase